MSINIALFSAKIENDFFCMVQIVWLVVQSAFFNVGRNWMKMIFPGTDGKISFHVFISKSVLLFSLVFNVSVNFKPDPPLPQGCNRTGR